MSATTTSSLSGMSAKSRRTTHEVPEHIAGWQLPAGWRWGAEGLTGAYRHYQEIIDGLGRSLSLVSAPDPAHWAWLHAEAAQLGHRSHPSIPTTFHYWTAQRDRGPGYLRRWVSGETVADRFERIGIADIPYVMQILRGAGSTLSYLHESGVSHGALAPDTLWVTPTGRLWMLEWQWAVPPESVPPLLHPPLTEGPIPPEWREEGWKATPASDQWQLAAMCYMVLTGESIPESDIPPVKWLRPETPESVASALDRALWPAPEGRFPSISMMVRAADRGQSGRMAFVVPGDLESAAASDASSDSSLDPSLDGDDSSEELRVRRAVRDDYEILSRLGSGTFGTVWRARDLSLEREVALKVLHQRIAQDGEAVAAFWREARLAAQLAHPAIVPIYDWDGRDGIVWYTMELAEGGSVANLVARMGKRSLPEIAQQVDLVLDGLGTAHGIGVVHRDLKPENILIDRYRRWRITDFGIANVTGEDASETMGTPGFAAPEQLLGEVQGPAVDYFALAAIVAFVLTGKQPFDGADAQSLLAQQLGRKADLSSLPPDIAEWIEIGLAPTPGERFADAQAMRRAWHVAVKATRRRERALRWWGMVFPWRKQ